MDVNEIRRELLSVSLALYDSNREEDKETKKELLINTVIQTIKSTFSNELFPTIEIEPDAL